MIEDEQTYITQSGYHSLKEELEYLKNIKRREVAERIQQAKEFGDLSENAEYTEAKNEQAFVEGRIAELESILKKAVIIQEDSGTKDVVSIGSKIKIHADGEIREYHIVGSQEADPVKGKISNESPIGKALLGCKIGDEVEITLPKGKMKCRIMEIK